MHAAQTESGVSNGSQSGFYFELPGGRKTRKCVSNSREDFAMARPGLTQHRKFLRLARTLGNEALALGSLEFMWGACYQNGDEYLG